MYVSSNVRTSKAFLSNLVFIPSSADDLVIQISLMSLFISASGTQEKLNVA